MRTAVILAAVVVVCSFSAIEAHAQSGYSLSVSSPTNGMTYTPGGTISVAGTFKYPWPCLGLTCSPQVWVTLIGPPDNTLWYNLDLNANDWVNYGYGSGDFLAPLSVYVNMPPGSYNMDVWLSDETTNPPAGQGSNVLGTPVFLTIKVI